MLVYSITSFEFLHYLGVNTWHHHILMHLDNQEKTLFITN